MVDVEIINYVSNNIKEAVSVFYMKSSNKVWKVSINDNGEMIITEA